MGRYAAFVRAVMIGREGLHRQVLLDIAAEAGGRDSVSYISTGNLTVDLDDDRVARWTTDVEAAITLVVGRPTEVFVRSIADLRALRATEAFASAPFEEVEERTVTFLAEPLAEPLALPFWSPRRDIAIVAQTPTEVFAVNRLVDGRMSGAGGLIERTLSTRVTTRSWTTVERILRKPTG